MRFREALIFAIYATAVEWLIVSLPVALATRSFGPPSVGTALGVFLVALFYLHKRSLVRPMQGAVLGTLSVLGAAAVTLALVTLAFTPDGARPAIGTFVMLSAFSLYFLPGLALAGAAAGALFVVIKRQLGLAGPLRETVRPLRRRRAIVWIAASLVAVLGLPVLVVLGNATAMLAFIAVTQPRGEHCNNADPMVLKVGDRIFTVRHEDQPRLYGDDIRSAGGSTFCQERPAGSPFNGASLTLWVKPERLGYEGTTFRRIEIRIGSRGNGREWGSFQRALEGIEKAGLTLSDLPREAGFLVFEDRRWRHFIASDEAAKTPSGFPITFWCDTNSLPQSDGERCSVFYAWSPQTHFVLSFSNMPSTPGGWLALHDRVRTFLADAERIVTQIEAE